MAESLRILVAEDDSLTRMDLCEMLVEMGHSVTGQASDGEAALRLARELKPDLAILDIQMPKMDGIEVAAAIAKRELCPVVILTAYTQADLVERAAQAGVFAYVVKPFDAASLAPAIAVAQSRFEQLKALNSEIADLSERLEARQYIERAKGILMEREGLTEAEAFKRIRTQSMNLRKPMKTIAEAIVIAYEATR